MDLFGLFACFTSNNFELLLYITRIVIPATSLCLWMVNSSFTDIFDRTTSATMAVVTGVFAFWCREPKRETTADNNGVKFHVTSKVDFPGDQKMCRKWLVSWKPLSEEGSLGGCNSVEIGNGVSSNGATKIIIFDRSTGVTFNIISFDQSTGGKELNGETIPENVNGIRKRSRGEMDKTK